MDEGSSTIETLVIVTSIALPPPPTSPPQTSIIPPTSTTTVSPTFVVVMQESIVALFSSQSIESEKTIPEDEVDVDYVMVSFADLQFNPKEYDILDELIMSSKKFKILNSKMIYIL
ncbi:unnamed protein product [Lactuca virosa]|uniref:Uncharacterized protein n=1 Tax=Lactuca virosa TaxID=75947 RepID=A0AAU9MAS8_9ASTR|nr:unnamed protein product [Lactuca virosa]